MTEATCSCRARRWPARTHSASPGGCTSRRARRVRSSTWGRTRRAGCLRSRAVRVCARRSCPAVPFAARPRPDRGREPVGALCGRARTGERYLDHLPGRREGGSSRQRGRGCHARREPDVHVGQPFLPWPLAGGRRADAARAAARRAHLPHRAGGAAGRDDSRQCSRAGQQPARGRGTPPPAISTAAIPRESPLASRVSKVPDVTVETIVGTLPRLPHTVRAAYRDNVAGPGRSRALAVADGQQRGGEARQLHGHRQGAGHHVRTESHGHRQGARSGSRRPRTASRGVSAQPGGARSRCRRPRDAVHAEPRQVHSRPRREQSRHRFSTTSATHSASRSRQARSGSKGGTTRRRDCAGTRAATT